MLQIGKRSFTGYKHNCV